MVFQLKPRAIGTGQVSQLAPSSSLCEEMKEEDQA